MAGLLSAINSATAGLRAIQTNVRVVSDNVARADDPNRSAHSVTRQTGADGAVIGVDFTRRANQSLATELNGAITREAGAETRSEYLGRVNDALGAATGQPALLAAAEAFAKAWRDLETTPESAVAKQEVVQQGDRMAREVRLAAEGVDQIAADMRSDLSQFVTDANDALESINTLNRQIASAGEGGASVNELRDRRDAAVRDLNELIGVTALEQPDGRLSVFTTTGLVLVEADAARLSFDGQNRVTLESSPGVDIQGHLSDGKIGTLVKFLADTSKTAPGRTPSPDPGVETIRKLRDQLDAIVAAFTGKTKAGEPTSFADAYNSAGPAAEGELDTDFFTGTGRFDFRVDAALLDGSKTLKASAVDAVATAVNATGRSYSATGLTGTNLTYAGMTASVITTWTTAAAKAADESDQVAEFKGLVEERYHSDVGVNLDEEIARLQELQNSYNAVARVMQIANAMFDTLESALR